jgi:hypothetical protein
MTDHFDRWLRSAGKRDTTAWESTVALFRDYSHFCSATGERCEGGVQQFSKELKRHLVRSRRRRGRGWRGFSLREPAG